MSGNPSNDTKRLSHLKKTINYLKENGTVTQVPDAHRQLSSFSERLALLPKGRWRVAFPKIEIPIRDSSYAYHNPILIIGGLIAGADSIINFSSLSICIMFSTNAPHQSSPSASCCLKAMKDQKRIVRRFHFDFQPDSANHPTSHLQYGGKWPAGYPDYHYCIEDFIDNPRFHYPPYDIVLLLDMLIREFRTDLRQLSSESFWKSLVRDSQELWCKDYYDKLYKCFGESSAKTIHELIYCGSA